MPTKENQADIASKWATPSKLLDSMYWWNGINMLLTPESEWPDFEHIMNNLHVQERLCIIFFLHYQRK